MKSALLFLPLLAAVLLPSCSHKVRPEESIRIAKSYAELTWQPEARHIRHGKDSRGIMVNTPDTTLKSTATAKGYWKPGSSAVGVPYKWGGFDPPKSFLKGIAAGKKAGDIATDQKIAYNDAAISHESVGVDCSGFLSRCWKLSKHTSTPDLPDLCDRIAWEDVRMGDMILRPGHVVLVHFKSGDNFLVYEAATIPTAKVRRRIVGIDELKRSNYLPWRYRFMAEPSAIKAPEWEESERLIQRHSPY
ncbi:MAG: hypothetical protein NWT08_01420 [Akkermansiaceae bacterium]|jgi:hypothetical protein|nr:hypothetical protein [Akkermansiaceae bacterium]MDP4721528.1 hypothetical protein [Akkermansiaceae bacterium]MDP4898239.1 hypothetical protein [Akkermansiaceae bacterium]